MKFAAVLSSAAAVIVGAWQAPKPAAAKFVSLAPKPAAAKPVSLAPKPAAAKPVSLAPKPAAAKPVSLAKKGDVMSQMGVMMATSQQSLAQAEALYDKALEEAKHTFSQLVTTEARDVAAKIGKYASSLTNASRELAQAANTTQAALAALTAAQGKDVPMSVVFEQAGVSAKVEAVAQQARQMARKSASKQEDAVNQAIQQLEDIDQGLSRKLGDVSSLQDDARAIVEAAGPGAGGDVAQAVSNTTKIAKLGKKPASLAEAEKSMDAAKAKAVADVAAADKRFAADLTKVSASVAAGAQSIKAEVDKAEKQEIQRVHEGKVDPTVPPQHHHRHHRHRLV